MNLLAVLCLMILLCCVCCVQCKSCPSATKAHLTRCDLYYKCMVVPSNKAQVWIPSKCDRGLVYEPSLELCVLPADDWECSLGDPSPEKPTNTDDQSNVYVQNDLQNLKQKIDTYQPVFYDSAANLQTDDLTESAASSSSSANIEVVEDFAQSRPNNSANDSAEESDDNDEEQLEASGDDDSDTVEDQTPLQQKTTATYLAVPAPSVSSHLQRLTQLIQSMAQAQQQQFEPANTRLNQTQELGPNDLNTFLANHDIQTGVRSQLLHINQRKQQTIGSDGRIPSQHIAEILELQQAIQHHSDLDAGGSKQHTATTTGSDSTVKLAENGQQIIVNRPGGSVLFQLPAAANNRPTDHQTISDDTLKTMLELSKQLLSSSTAAAAARPPANHFETYGSFVRPVYYNIPVEQNFQGGFERPQSRPSYAQSLPTPYDQPADDRSTIIHNHIPITIENRKPADNDRFQEPGKVQTTETRYDSFGNKVVTNYQTAASLPEPPTPFIYPPIASKTEEPPSIYSPYGGGAFPESFYPVTPHLSDQNVNNHVNVITPAYPTLRPTPPYRQQPAAVIRLQSDPIAENAPSRPNLRQPRPTSAQIGDAINQQKQQPQQPQKRHDSIDPNSLHYADDNTGNDYNANNDAENYVVDYAENESLSAGDNNAVHSSVAQPQQQQHHSNNQNVISALPSSSASSRPSFAAAANQFGTLPASSSSASVSHHNNVVHYGDTYMPYADYKQSIAPLLSTAGRDQVEVLACVTGARQPSSGDCAKYFVCNASTGKVMTYVCPQYTAFNRASRFCDARTYAECKATDNAVIAERTATVAENRLREQQQQMQQQQQQVQLLQEPIEADYYDNNDDDVPAPLRQATPQQHQQLHPFQLLNRPHRRRPTPRPTANSHRRVVPQTRATTTTTTTTTTTPRPAPPMRRRQKVPSGPMKRLIKCTEPTKVRDSLSVYNYFSCFTGADGELKAVKQTCPNGLVFCAKTKICTSQDRCKGQKMVH